MTTMLLHLVLATLLVVANGLSGFRWRVTVYTGIVPYGGTDNAIYVVLVDGTTRKKSTMYLLESDHKDNMEENGIDSFDVPFNSIGNLTRIRVHQYGRDGWFMAYMRFIRKDEPDKEYFFSCHCWFDTYKWRYIRLLRPGIKPSCDWEVRVMTGLQSRAGTDNNVYVEVYGNWTWSATYRLNSGGDDFRRGITNVFPIQMKCLNIEKIKVIFTGQNDSWFPYTFEFIRKDDRSLTYLFPVHQWIDERLTKTIELIDPGNYPFCDWIVKTFTGKEPRAGTDNALYIELIGNVSSTSYYQIGTANDDHEWGKMDTFLFQSQCLTPDRVAVTIRGDDGWYLEHIEISTTADPDIKYVFSCHCWLDDSKSVYIDVIPPGEKSTCEWIVKVSTGIHKYADTDDEVRIQIFANGTSTSYHRLDSEHDDFDWGKTDVFNVRSKCIIPVKIKMKIGGRDGWLLSKVELQRKDAMDTTYVFPCHCWLDDAGHKYVNMHVSKDPGTCMWFLQVWTGTLPYSSTNSKFFLEMVGDGERSDHITLNVKSQYLKSDARGEFHFNSSCMTPKQLLILLDRDNDWFMEWIQIYRTDKVGNRESYDFSCYCWLRKGVTQEINTIGPDGIVSCDWRVYVWTSPQLNSETYDGIKIRLISNDESTSFFQLNNFRRMEMGSKNEYSLTTRCFIPNQVQIKTSGFDAWGLKKIELTRTDNMGKQYTFNCDCSLTSNSETYLDARG